MNGTERPGEREKGEIYFMIYQKIYTHASKSLMTNDQ